MTVIKKDLAVYKGFLHVKDLSATVPAYVRVPILRGLVATIDTSNEVTLDSDDEGTVISLSNAEVSIEAELLQNMSPETLALFLPGTVTTDVDGNKTFNMDLDNIVNKEFSVKIESFPSDTNKKTIECTKMKFTSQYNLAFQDFVKSGSSTGSSLTFTSISGAAFSLKDETITPTP